MPSATSSVLRRPVVGPSAWVAADHGGPPSIDMGDEVVSALVDRARALREEGKTVADLTPDDFDLDLFRPLAASVATMLDAGPGFVVLKRLPVEDLDGELIDIVYRGLGSTVGAVRPHSRLGDDWIWRVTDETDDGDVQHALTTGGLPPHSDTATTYLDFSPETIAQLLVHKAQEGGASIFVASHTVFNRLLESDPAVVETLAQPFYWERAKEWKEDEIPYRVGPVLEVDSSNAIALRINRGWIDRGHTHAGVPQTAEQERALDALAAVLADPDGDLTLEFDFGPGEVVFANNHTVLHGRTPYVDPPVRDERRLLLHLWIERRGGTS